MSRVIRVGSNISGVFAAGSLLLYWRHLKESQIYANVRKEEPSPLVEDTSDLKLCQVQVVFRHGARTPIHTLPKLSQADFGMCMAPHPSTLFPFQRISFSTRLPIEYGAYQKSLEKNPLNGGVFPGMLSSYGQDQLLMLGRRLKKDYQEELKLQSFNPDDVFVLSTNIQRTVESLRCVMSGFFGADNLCQLVNNNKQPITMYVTDESTNILMPDGHRCPLIRKINHAAMKDFESIHEIKQDRIELEKNIGNVREPIIEEIEVLEKNIKKLTNTDHNKVEVKMNKSGQRYVENTRLQPLLEARNKKAESVPYFWSDVLCRYPGLANSLTRQDMKALVYLNRFEVEKLPEPSRPFEATGFRYIFHFEKNPFFYDQSLTKEVYSYVEPDTKHGGVKKYIKPTNLKSSWSSQIHWKPGGESLIERKEDASGDKPSKQSKNSFFSWYKKPTKENDTISEALRDIYSFPLEYYHLEPVKEEFDHRPYNFVFVRDDLVAREVHGFKVPSCVNVMKDSIDKNATTMMHNAVAGQVPEMEDTVSRLGVGRLIWEMGEQMKRRINEGFMDGKKMVLYSAHDTTLSVLMSALGIWDETWPPFGADIRLELWQSKSKNHFVRILYNGKPVCIRGQDKELISWQTFRRLVSPVTLTEKDFSNVCRLESIDGMQEAYKKLPGESEADHETEEAPAGM